MDETTILSLWQSIKRELFGGELPDVEFELSPIVQTVWGELVGGLYTRRDGELPVVALSVGHPDDIAATLLHEAVHAKLDAAGNDSGHGPAFIAEANRIGEQLGLPRISSEREAEVWPQHLPSLPSPTALDRVTAGVLLAQRQRAILTNPAAILQRCGDTLGPMGNPITQAEGTGLLATDPGTMSADFIAVTRTPQANRHGNKVHILPNSQGGGLRLDAWRENPVWLWNHGQGLGGLPIGTSRDATTGEVFVDPQPDAMAARVHFSQRLPEAAALFALVDEGILRAASIQFLPVKAKPLPGKGLDFVESELLEISVVPIGADRGALKQALDIGRVGGERLTGALRQSLQRCVCVCTNPKSCSCHWEAVGTN